MIAAACEDAPALSTQSRSGEWIELRYAEDDAPCAGTLDYLDAAFERYAALTGADLVDPRRVTVVANAEDAMKRCGGPACTVLDTAFVADVSEVHEVAHLAQFQLRDRIHPLVAEGFAVAMANPSITRQLYGESDAFLAAVQSFDFSNSHYAVAGDFIAFIIWKFGSDAVRDVVDRVPADSSLEQFSNALAEVTGMSTDEIVSARQALNGDFTATHFARPACSLDSLVVDDAGVDLDVRYDCSNPFVVGMELRTFRLWSRRITIPTSGDYYLIGHAQGRQRVRYENLFAPCDDSDMRTKGPVESVWGSSDFAIFLHREAGEYVLEMSGTQARDAISWQIERVDGGHIPSIPDTIDRIIVHGRAGEVVLGRFSTEVPIEASYVAESVLNPTLCTDSPSGPSCSVLTSMPTFDFTIPVGTHSLFYEAVEGASEGEIIVVLNR